MNKSVAWVMVFVLAFAHVAFAQEAASGGDGSADAPMTDSTPAAASVGTDAVPVEAMPDAIATSTSVQATENTQEGVTGDMLESTVNPESAPADDSNTLTIEQESQSPPVDMPVEQATSSEALPLPEAPALDVVADLPATSSPEETVSTIVAPAPLSSEDLQPEPEFSFSLTGSHLATHKRVERSDGAIVTAEAVTRTLTPEIDSSGAIHVSGQCSSDYFVVLLFKHPEDYANDPRSYVLNKAYPCVGGHFDYSIADMPVGLPNGSYYLLIGEQAAHGPWTPITEMTEVRITSN